MPIKLMIEETQASAASLVSALIADAVKTNPKLVLGLSAGRTMQPLYQDLCEQFAAGKIDFSKATALTLDEYVGLSPSKPTSHHSYMQENLFKRINIRAENTHIPNGVARELQVECLRYDRLIEKCGGIDFQLLGLGEDGHIGLNEPFSSFHSTTRVVKLAPQTIQQKAPQFKSNKAVPRSAITVGVGSIMSSGKCVMLVTGKHKARILAQVLEGKITPLVPATVLRMHRACIFVVDREAAQELTSVVYNEDTLKQVA